MDTNDLIDRAKKYDIGKPYRTNATYAGGWSRVDTYLPTNSRELVHVAGPNDVSLPFNGYTDGSDSERCDWCYLGYNHTHDEHAANVAEYIAAGRTPEPASNWD